MNSGWISTKKIQNSKIHPSHLSKLDFSGGILISGGDNCKLAIWNSANGKKQKVTDDLKNSSVGAVHQYDRKTILAGFQSGKINLFSLDENGLSHKGKLDGPKEYVFGLDIHFKLKLLAASSQDGRVYLWKNEEVDENLEEEVATKPYWSTNSQKEYNCVYSVKFLGSNSHFMASADSHGGVCIHNIEKDGSRTQLYSHQKTGEASPILNMCFDEDKNLLFSVGEDDRSAIIFDTQSRKEVERIENDEKLTSVLYLKKNHELVLGEGSMTQCPGGKLKFYDMRKIDKKSPKCDLVAMQTPFFESFNSVMKIIYALPDFMTRFLDGRDGRMDLAGKSNSRHPNEILDVFWGYVISMIISEEET